MRRVAVSNNDFGLFDGELNTPEYEYFSKHQGAFKRLMQEEPVEERLKFLDAFCEYSYNNIEIKAVGTMSDPKKKFIESFREYVQETFIKGKFSAAKQFMNDTVLVVRNRHMIHHMDSHSYAKDPFFHKETRDAFRRLFGQPTEAGTCVKVVCVLPLYVRFAGSVCRYLRRWLALEEASVPVRLTSKANRAKNKKSAKDETSKTVSVVSQQALQPSSKPSENSSSVLPDDDVEFSKLYYDMHERKQRKREKRVGRKRKTQLENTLPNPTPIPPAKVEHVQEKVVSQTSTEDNVEAPLYDPKMLDCLCKNCRAVAEVRLAEEIKTKGKLAVEELAKEIQEGRKIEFRRSLAKTPEVKNLEVCQSAIKISMDAKFEVKTSEDTKSEVKTSEDNKSEVKTSQDAKSDVKTSQDAKPEVKTSGDTKSEVKTPEGTKSEVKTSEDTKSKVKTSEDAKSEVAENDKGTEEKSNDIQGFSSVSSGNENSEKRSIEVSSPEMKTSDFEKSPDRCLEDQMPESKSPDDERHEAKISDGVSEKLEDAAIVREETVAFTFVNGSKTSENGRAEERWTEGKEVGGDNEPAISVTEIENVNVTKSRKKILANGVVGSDSSDFDSDEERFVRESFPQLHLGKPHPNEEYENMRKLEEKLRESIDVAKVRSCAYCRVAETEEKKFKKCQRCRGKRTKFYCSRECQKKDWPTHRMEHQN